MGLEVSEAKTKYMKCDRGDYQIGQNVIIDECRVESVDSFNYLGVLIHRKGERQEDIRRRINAGNKAYYANKNMLISKKLTKNTKMKIYKTLVRPVVSYASETLCMSADEEEQLRVFERRIMRSILGPKKVCNEEQRALMNHEITRIMNGEDIVKYIKSQRLRWLGHVMRANNSTAIKAITVWRPSESRPRGRPRIRWWDQVASDLKEMKINGWTGMIGDRQRWRCIVMEAVNHPRL